MRLVMACMLALGALALVPAASAQEPSRGKQVFDLWCGGCHKPIGPYVSSVAGTVVLERKYQGAKPGALEQRTDLSAAVVKFYVRHGVKFMPYFRKTEISESDLDALAAYLAKAQ
jgi:mono/diheme cytochrome c family protein